MSLFDRLRTLRELCRREYGDEFKASRDRYPELYADFRFYAYMVDADMAEHETRRFARQLAAMRGEGESE